MFYLRATQKILHTSKLKPEDEPENIDPVFEWYTHLFPTGHSDKMLILYVHSLSKIAILARGKRVLKTQEEFLERFELFLIRHGFDLEKREKIIPSGNPLILKTNSRSMLGFINNYIVHFDYKFKQYPSFEAIDLSVEEDVISIYPIWIAKNKLGFPIDLLKNTIYHL